MSSLKQFTILLLIICLNGCLEDQSGRTGRPLIVDFSTIEEEESSGCTDFMNETLTDCLESCPLDYHTAGSEELETLIAELAETTDTSNLEFEEGQTIETYLAALIAQSKGICLLNIVRPSNAVYVNSNYCACKDSTPIILNNCLNYCYGKSTSGEESLFVTTRLGDEITLNEELGSLTNWCNKEIGDGNVQPSCTLELYDGSSTQELPIVITGTTSFKVDIQTLPNNITYVAKLKEKTSEATSDTFQIRKYEHKSESEVALGPLKIMSVSQYSCMSRMGDSINGSFNATHALRYHFYFAANKTPPSLPPINNTVIYCHDIETYGINDSPLYPRLELIPQQFAVWDESDNRFVDSDGNGIEDISDTMSKRLLDEFGITTTLDVFDTRLWPNVITYGDDNTIQNLGFIMTPWLDDSGKGFCPTQQHYNGDQPVFKVMKEEVGVDTEGLYIGLRQTLNLIGEDGSFTPAPHDILLIRENLLNKIWFYYENNKHYTPDDVTAGQKTIMFYWPPDIDHPHVRKSTQYIYTVTAPDQVDTTAAPDGALSTNVVPPDKRLGCVPSLGDD
jgi:hypothetical protein